MIFLSETWLSNTLTTSATHPYRLPNYNPNFINIGNGKGLASFSESEFQLEKNDFEADYQLAKYSFSFLHYTGISVPIEIIGLYRSSTCTHDNTLLHNIKKMVDKNKISIICGDFNIRFQDTPRPFLVDEILKMNFNQLIDHPTHREGGIIDHLYTRRPPQYSDVLISWELFAPFYSDHYAISIVINKDNNQFLQMPSTIPDGLFIDTPAPQSATSKKDHANVVGKKRKTLSTDTTRKARK